MKKTSAQEEFLKKLQRQRTPGNCPASSYFRVFFAALGSVRPPGLD